MSLAFARAGADVAVTDLAGPVADVPYPGSTSADLDATRELVEREQRRCIALVADVRSQSDMTAAVDECTLKLGRLDYVVANAGVFSGGVVTHNLSDAQWQGVLDVCVTGAWNTARAALPKLKEQRSGAVTFISSIAGLGGVPNFANYATAKHAVIGLARSVALEYGPFGVRANVVCPTVIDTPMTNNPFYTNFFGGRDNASRTEMLTSLRAMHALPISMIEADDVANAVVWLSSAQARYITGVVIPVDAGVSCKVG
jgi:NAD(P)-dependent dehydrogenase (short-subunit alcohol dehydrogenase family)